MLWLTERQFISNPRTELLKTCNLIVRRGELVDGWSREYHSDRDRLVRSGWNSLPVPVSLSVDVNVTRCMVAIIM